MDENTTSGLNGNEDMLPDNEAISKSDAMIGVITEPSVTFHEVARTEGKNYWIIPILISIILGLISSFIFMSNNELKSSVMDKQKDKMEKQMNEKVQKGEMSASDKDKAIEQSAKFMDPNGMFFKLIGYGGAVVGPFLLLFIPSIFYLIGLKIFKADFVFSNVLNVVGLSYIIYAVGTMIGMVLSVVMGHMVTAGLALVLNEEMVGSKVFQLISKLDLFSIWEHVVIMIGLSKIGKIEIMKSGIVVFGIWIVWILLSTIVFG
ncbi:hypothetical protein BH10BAC5_BH10BAC5_13760 [soil metagenome]